MAYTPPTRLELRDNIARDLRDPAYAAFSTQDVDDFINFGIAEVNRVYPAEHIEEFAITDVEDREYATVLTHIWRVEMWRDGKWYQLLVPNDSDSSIGGWELYAQLLTVPDLSSYLNVDSDIFKAWGYTERPTLSEDTDVLEYADIDAEMGIRTFAVQQGYGRLLNDRSLFQQWQTQANNADVSPTQLNGMFALRAGEWDTLRNRIRRVRRVA